MFALIIFSQTFLIFLAMNPDICKEREGASFDVKELTDLLHGGHRAVERRHYLESLLKKDPVFKKDDFVFLSREESYSRSLQKGVHYLQLLKRHDITSDDDKRMLQLLIGTPLPFNLHNGMFIPCIKKLGTDEQQDKWLPLAESHQNNGTYAQTELGHGTFIRGLETTATYDSKREEFVIHSPTRTSCKWWPGNLGKGSTHAIVAAQLKSKGKEHGIHLFIVQLRDLNTLEPLPGITVGDIGPKNSYAFQGIDNGFLSFNHVRIPRNHMLMRYSQVDADGMYTNRKAGNKANYGTMVFVRAVIVFDSYNFLSKAVVIAIRYSAVRRQSERRPGEREAQVLDYQTQRRKLFPILAATYAFKFCAEKVWTIYKGVQEQVASEHYDMLPEVHSITCALKAFTTSLACHYAEVCRQSCGGHGYLSVSMLPELQSIISASCTYEGDTTVLMLQVARYLMKCTAMVHEGKSLPSSVSYLKDAKQNGKIVVYCENDFLKPQIQRTLYEQRAARLIVKVAEKLQKKVLSGMDSSDAWNEASADLVRCAQAHAWCLSVGYCLDSIQFLSGVSENVKSVLVDLANLYILEGIEAHPGDFLEADCLDINQVSEIREHVYALLDKIRPNAVALVDAFDISDYALNSPLGCYDGNVYDRLYETAQRSSLNRKQVLPAQEKYLLPMLRANRSKL